jgi:hypothetical protein
MAVISESELAIRLDHSNNAAKGRTLGARNIPDSLRAVIGFNAHFEKAEDVAASFGVAPITAHLAKESRGHEESRDKIQTALGAVKDQALAKMLVAMGAIKVESIKKMKPFAALRMAKGLAEIVDKTSEKAPPQTENNVVIYAPQVRQENTYEKVVEIDRGLING